MRVVINGWFWERPATGSGQYLRHLVAAFADLPAKCAVRVLLPGIPPPPALGPVTFQTLPVRPGHRGKVLWEQVAVPRAARQMGADVLHVPYWAPPLRAAMPVVVTVHDLIPLLLPEYRGGAAVRLYTHLVRVATTRAAVVLTDSEASRQDIVRHLRVHASRVQTIHLAASSAYRPEPSPGDAHVLAALGLQPGYVLYLGGFDARKNLQAVCTAFAQLSQVVSNARLVIAGKLPSGDSAFAPDPRRLAREAGIPASAITFTGFVPDAQVPALYRGARVFIFPSTFEGFGLPPLEALSCGVPVVASQASSLPEVVGEGGLLVPPMERAALVHALQRLMTDDGLHADLRRRALQQAARFSWAQTAKLTLAAYGAGCST